MLIIDFRKLNPQYLSKTMSEVEVTDFNNLSLLTILERLDLSAETAKEEYFPMQQYSSKTDLSVKIQGLRQTKKIADVIGPIKLQRGTPVYFSTLLGLRPKEYLKQYTEVAKALCNTETGLNFTVWLEDTLTILKNNWDILTSQQAITAYQTFFGREFSEAQVLVSSQVAPAGIPQSFTEKLSSISTEEFLSVLPFHLRNSMFVRVFDLVHFVWNCYLLYRLPGIHLAGINNKRHFQIFRKITGPYVTAVLLPLGPESYLK